MLSPAAVVHVLSGESNLAETIHCMRGFMNLLLASLQGKQVRSHPPLHAQEANAAGSCL